MEQPRLLIGAMSGTSADGVDVALVRIAGRGLEMKPAMLRHHHCAYDAGIRRVIFDIRAEGKTELRELARLGRDITLTYAAAVNELMVMSKTRAPQIAAVAAHGQTLFHDPPDTIQWFDPALLSAETGCAVVSDFRRADCAAGGQGAPLVPFADYILFADANQSRAVVNIGGIANVTLLPAACRIEDVTAFDTGPGNCISDQIMRRHFPNGPAVDVDGKLASNGRPHPQIVKAVLDNPYFAQRGPKSTDGPAMIALYDAARRGTTLSVEDELATACAITAAALALSCGSMAQAIVSGGGIRNATLMRMLRQRLASVRTSDELGVMSEAKEAIAFALLGAATLDGAPSNVPSATGARRRVVLGSITPAQH